jgi:HAD superfamily hydrolase (TIGR01459 family)
MAELPSIIGSLEDIASRYQAILCDVWGVVHNGERAFPAASAALAAARRHGLAVVLITNAPRPSPDVVAQLATLGVPVDAWDAVVTSGDVTRDLIVAGPRKIHHLGPDRDFSIYDGIDIDMVEEFEASAVVCTGLFDDETEVPEDYAAALRRFRARDLPFICANPDIVVERGDRLIWCAGALARDYALLGGRTFISGKPHRPIYAASLKAAGQALGRELAATDVLAIGDGMLTDVKGADDNGIDVLYVSGGIHASEYGDVDNPDLPALAAFLEAHGRRPVAVIPRLK